MIRGVQKNIIVIKNTDSDIFEEAIFIINPKKGYKNKKDLKKEAKRIIAEKSDHFSRKKGLFK